MLRRLIQMPLIVVLLGLTALLCWVPAIHALALGQHIVARAFFYSGGFLLMLTVMLALATAAYRPRNVARNHLTTLIGAYVILPFIMAMPVVQAVPDTTLANAWFEMLSSFTTTGATGYESARLPLSVHLWRALVGWFGGFYILLAAYAVLAPLNLGGAEVISGRVPGRGASQTRQITRIAEPAERITRYALVIFPVYGGLTLILWVGLLMAGEDSLAALVHAMGTLSTSGISAGAGPAASASGVAGEALILIFLIFAVTRRALPFTGLADRNFALWRDPELRIAGLLLIVVPMVLVGRHWLVTHVGEAEGPVVATGSIWATIWGAVFTAGSFLTTTGYESIYWSATRLWSGLEAPGMMLLGLAMMGGGVATTAGGVKLLRVYALFRHGQRELQRIVHPNSVGGSGMDARRMRREGAYMAWVFFMLFAMSIAVTILALSMANLQFQEALVLAIAAMTTTGPLADVALAQPIGYGQLSIPVKAVLGVAMIVGRLETLALIALFAPGGWRR
ncbi:MAG: potassium transporter TrkG [Paracoccaceae bacterium]